MDKMTLVFSNQSYVSVKFLKRVGLISNSKEFFDRVPAKHKIRVVSEAAYNSFVEFANKTSGEVVSWILSENDSQFDGFDVKPAEYVSRKYIQKRL